MQSPSAVLNIGADVAKDAIVVACSEGSFPVREVANQRPAVLAFLKGLPAGSRIGVESTGTYHELFAETAHQLGFRVFLRKQNFTRVCTIIGVGPVISTVKTGHDRPNISQSTGESAAAAEWLGLQVVRGGQPPQHLARTRHTAPHHD